MDIENIRGLIASFFVVDSIWSVVLRGGVWFAISIVILVSTDMANPQKANLSLKRNLGFFVFFLVLSGGLIYLLFGFSSAPSVSAYTEIP